MYTTVGSVVVFKINISDIHGFYYSLFPMAIIPASAGIFKKSMGARN
jgi:hypothetical protein